MLNKEHIEVEHLVEAFEETQETNGRPQPVAGQSLEALEHGLQSFLMFKENRILPQK